MPSLRGWNRRATHTGGKGPGCPPRMLFPDLSPLASGSLGRHGPSPRPGWRLGPNETACQPYPPSVQSPLPQIRGRSRRPREPTCNPTHPPEFGHLALLAEKSRKPPSRPHECVSLPGRRASEGGKRTRRPRTSRLHACAPSRAAWLLLRARAPRPARLPGPAPRSPVPRSCDLTWPSPPSGLGLQEQSDV